MGMEQLARMMMMMDGGHGDGVLQAGVDEVLLFKGAVTSSPASLLLACVILFVSAIVLEYLRLLAWWLENRYIKCLSSHKEDNQITCNGIKTDPEADPVNPYKLWSWIVLGVLHAGIYVWGTCLMLITMSFNIFIIISIALGVSIGKLATMYTKAKRFSSKQ